MFKKECRDVPQARVFELNRFGGNCKKGPHPMNGWIKRSYWSIARRTGSISQALGSEFTTTWLMIHRIN